MSQRKRKTGHYGYGIVDADGLPYWDAESVWTNRSRLDNKVVAMNADPKRYIYGPYRVVSLVWKNLPEDSRRLIT